MGLNCLHSGMMCGVSNLKDEACNEKFVSLDACILKKGDEWIIKEAHAIWLYVKIKISQVTVFVYLVASTRARFLH